MSPEILSFPLAAAPNYSLYVVGEDMNVLPAGLPGEVVIGGGVAAAGYFNNTLVKAE